MVKTAKPEKAQTAPAQPAPADEKRESKRFEDFIQFGKDKTVFKDQDGRELCTISRNVYWDKEKQGVATGTEVLLEIGDKKIIIGKSRDNGPWLWAGILKEGAAKDGKPTLNEIAVRTA